MTKKIKVISPFYGLEVGDTLTLSDDGKMYLLEVHKGVNSETGLQSTFDFVFKIGASKAKELVELGTFAYVEEEKEKKSSSFVNVFDEIDNLLEEFQEEAKKFVNANEDKPSWLQKEHSNVIESNIDLLMYLKSLKK
nr:MAG TPA: hypothetical protein [Caudoviricetes sp.]